MPSGEVSFTHPTSTRQSHAKKCRKSDIKIAYINARSILPKVEQVQHLLYSNNIHLLAVGETWLDESVLDSEIDIDGYSVLRRDRNRHGGGVMFYVCDNVSYKHVSITTEEVENIWLSLVVNKKSYLIGNIYRPPSSHSDYFDNMLDLIEQATNISENVIVVGDLNYDCSAGLSINPLQYIESMFEMKQLVTSPTRITTTSSTLIDVILSNVPDHHETTTVLPVCLSDHFPVVTILRSQEKIAVTHKVVQFRDYKHFVSADFLLELKDKLQQHHHSNDVDCDPEKLWQSFKSIFVTLSNRHAPVKSMRLKKRYCPWINQETIELMYKRDNLHKKAVRDKNTHIWREYTALRNKITSLIRSEKRKYYNNELCENVNDPKQFWKTINKLTGKSAMQSAPKEISANDFNEYFSNIGHKVVSNNLHTSVHEPLNWKNPPGIHTFKFRPTSDVDVDKLIRSLGSESSNDVIGFDTKLLNISSNTIAPFIATIVNSSFKYGKVPNDFKFSRVTPVYKSKGCKNDMNNYRPISVIGHIAKVMEKVSQRQFLSYLLENDLIVVDQSAYRPSHNTQTALHRVVDSWIDNMSDGLLTGVCLLDISKCFDTINHELLIEKLSFYGVKDIELKWFSDYLANRSQVVSHNNVLSQKNDVTIGVPQGSVLGPILFMIFANDLSQNSGNGTCNLYADDTIAYCQGYTVHDIQEKLQLCVSQLSGWYSNNKLSVNTTKCEVMLITSRHRSISDDLDITINGTSLNYVHCAKYLGMQIDGNLSWNTYIDKLCANVACKLNRLKRVKGTIQADILNKIYTTAIQPCIDYAISVWGQTSECNIKKIQRMQNYAARIVTNNFDYINCRGINIVKSLRWMNVKQRCKYFTITLMFKCIHGLAPSYLSDEVVMNCDVNMRNTRSHPMNVYVPSVSSQFAKMSFKYAGAVAWNDLPFILKDIHDYYNFKSRLKQYILN